MRTIAGRIIYYMGLPVVWLAFKGSTRAYILVECQGEILFVKSWFGNQKWKLPGGGLKKNEPQKTGAVRELHEETGIKLEESALKRIVELDQTHAGAKYRHVVFITSLKNKPKTSKSNIEIMDLRWLKPSKINASNSSQTTIKALIAGGFEAG